MKTILFSILFLLVSTIHVNALKISETSISFKSDSLPIERNKVTIRDSVSIRKNGEKITNEVLKEKLDQRRNLWLEKAHRTAPGILWREIENNNLLKNYKEDLFLKKAKTAIINNFANGLLCGSWAERGSNNQAGRCIGVDYNESDNSLYVLSDAGSLFEGIPDSAKWHPTNDQLAFKNNLIKITKNSTGGKRILSVIGLNIFYSDDNGISFFPSSGITFPVTWAGNYIHEIASLTDSTTLYLITRPWDPQPWDTRYWLYSSTDHGQSWQHIYTFPFGNDNRLHLWKPDGQQNLVYVLSNQNAGNISTLYSISGISNIRVVNTSSTLPTNTNMLFSGNITGITTTLYAAINDTLYKSVNLGANWVFVSILPVNTEVLTVSPIDSNKLFIGQIDAYRSFNGGVTWTILNSWTSYYANPSTQLHADIFNIKYFKRNNGTYFEIINCDGGCYRSDNDLQTVTNIGLNGLNICEYYSVISDPQSNLFIGSQDQGIQRVTSTSTNTNILPFEQVLSGDYGKLQLTSNNQTLWAEYPGGNMYTLYNSLGGISAYWRLPGSTLPVAGWMLATAPVYPAHNNQIYLGGGNLSGGSGSYLVKLTTMPNQITATQGIFDFRGSTTSGISAIATTPLDTNRIYIAKEDGSFYYSNNAGMNWAKSVSFSGPVPQYFFGNCIYASKKTYNLVLFGGSGYSNPGVYKSTDGGVTFKPLNNGLPSTLIFGFAADANESFIYGATEAGPYVFSKADSTWYPLGGGIAPALAYWAVDYDEINNIAHFASFGRGIWDFNVCPTIPQKVEVVILKKGINISPNPFTSGSTITFDNPLQDKCILTIYDTQGRLVRTIANIITNKIEIDRQNLTTGIYFLQLRSNKQIIATEKLIIEKAP